MLFPLATNTPQCKVFEVLNNELLYFLEQSIHASPFNKDLFTTYTLMVDGEALEKISACWLNLQTRDKFQALYNELPTTVAKRQNLFNKINSAQDIRVYFNDLVAPLPELDNDKLFNAFKALTTHLYTRSKDLVDIKTQAGSSIEQHYQQYKQANNNTQLCYQCGTSYMSQDRDDVDDDEQWRADYDHILCKDKYPIYSVHPGNFIPTCHICNSKAKGARNLLKCKLENRRVAFYPLPPSNESCHEYVSVEACLKNLSDLSTDAWDAPLASAKVIFENVPLGLTAKIDVWEEVYQLSQRVESQVTSNLICRLFSDLMNPQDYNDFIYMLKRRTQNSPDDLMKTEWRFWWQCVYRFIVKQSDSYLKDLWFLMDWKRAQTNQADMEATFGQT